MNGGDHSMNNHTFSQHDCDSNNGDMSNKNGFINRHTLSLCDDTSICKDMDEDV